MNEIEKIDKEAIEEMKMIKGLTSNEIEHILETQQSLCDIGKGSKDDGRCPLCQSIKNKLETGHHPPEQPDNYELTIREILEVSRRKGLCPIVDTMGIKICQAVAKEAQAKFLSVQADRHKDKREAVAKILCRKMLIVYQGIPIDVYLPDCLVIELTDQLLSLFPTPNCQTFKEFIEGVEKPRSFQFPFRQQKLEAARQYGFKEGQELYKQAILDAIKEVGK